MKHLVLILATASLLASSTTAAAFDDRRKGFILGGGVGGSWTSFTQEVNIFGKSDRINKLGLATDFKIGAGLSDRLLIYYVNRGSWFSMENVLGETVTIFNSVGFAGASWYVTPEAYVMGLIGVASWSAPLEDSSMQVGLGLGAGAGYEYRDHWTVEATINWGRPGDSEAGIEVTTSAISLLVIVAVLAY